MHSFWAKIYLKRTGKYIIFSYKPQSTLWKCFWNQQQRSVEKEISGKFAFSHSSTEANKQRQNKYYPSNVFIIFIQKAEVRRKIPLKASLFIGDLILHLVFNGTTYFVGYFKTEKIDMKMKRKENALMEEPKIGGKHNFLTLQIVFSMEKCFHSNDDPFMAKEKKQWTTSEMWRLYDLYSILIHDIDKVQPVNTKKKTSNNNNTTKLLKNFIWSCWGK